MKKWFTKILPLLSLLLITACGGRGVYLYADKDDPRSDLDRPWVIIGAKGLGSKTLAQRLCEEAELRDILKEARLSEAEEESLFQAACGPEASATTFLRLYYHLPAEKRLRIRESFQKHGYSLNDYGC